MRSGRSTAATFAAAVFAMMGAVEPALAADIDGAKLGWLWAAPFAGMLLSIALGPLVAAHLWHAHYGKVAAFWAALCAIPMAIMLGAGATAAALFHTFAVEYLPFILMLCALYTAAGGIVVRGALHDTPAVNTAILATGAACASVIGTTGAAMVFIRPLLRANDDRKHNVHVVVFFIILVANVGGALTPLGDPPLFLGFLRGVDFFWTTTHLWKPTLFMVVVLLVAFYAFDSVMQRREPERDRRDPTPDSPLRVTGLINLALIGVAIAAILLSARFQQAGGVTILGTSVPFANIAREATMIAVALASLALTRAQDRRDNDFNWEPIVEVAKLFAGIFVCIIPVLAMLDAGRDGVFAPLVSLVARADGAPNTLAYFWLTGLLSSFLDNAPTYLVFFELAGGHPQTLMTTLAPVLTAISLGAVFMGANTYIGNAPNFMVYAIARANGVAMPSFFGYMVWSFAIMMPLYLLVGWLFL